MPTTKGYSHASMSKNVKEMVKSGMPQDQAVAAAYQIARKAAKKAGKRIPKAK